MEYAVRIVSIPNRNCSGILTPIKFGCLPMPSGQRCVPHEHEKAHWQITNTGLATLSQANSQGRMPKLPRRDMVLASGDVRANTINDGKTRFRDQGTAWVPPL